MDLSARLTKPWFPRLEFEASSSHTRGSGMLRVKHDQARKALSGLAGMQKEARNV